LPGRCTGALPDVRHSATRHTANFPRHKSSHCGRPRLFLHSLQLSRDNRKLVGEGGLPAKRADSPRRKAQDVGATNASHSSGGQRLFHFVHRLLLLYVYDAVGELSTVKKIFIDLNVRFHDRFKLSSLNYILPLLCNTTGARGRYTAYAPVALPLGRRELRGQGGNQDADSPFARRGGETGGWVCRGA
jgi:ribosomal protein S14